MSKQWGASMASFVKKTLHFFVMDGTKRVEGPLSEISARATATQQGRTVSAFRTKEPGIEDQPVLTFTDPRLRPRRPQSAPAPH